MDAARMNLVSPEPSAQQYFSDGATSPPEVWACISRDRNNLNLPVSHYFGQGCNLPREVWAWLNREGAFSDPSLTRFVAPFPPKDLMENVSGPISERGFASHGADFWLALSELVRHPLAKFDSVLDYGCGCGRLSRMFKGYTGMLYGCDINAQHIEWMSGNIPFCSAHVTKPDAALSFSDGQFDLIIAISIFTHLTEHSQQLLLRELFRIARPGGVLLLTVHGERAIERVINEPKIWEMISVDRGLFEEAKSRFDRGEYGFVQQWEQYPWCDPTCDPFPYGISFIPKSYIASQWGKWFRIEKYASGAVHDWQDVIVMQPREVHTPSNT